MLPAKIHACTMQFLCTQPRQPEWVCRVYLIRARTASTGRRSARKR